MLVAAANCNADRLTLIAASALLLTTKTLFRASTPCAGGRRDAVIAADPKYLANRCSHRFVRLIAACRIDLPLALADHVFYKTYNNSEAGRRGMHRNRDCQHRGWRLSWKLVENPSPAPHRTCRVIPASRLQRPWWL